MVSYKSDIGLNYKLLSQILPKNNFKISPVGRSTIILFMALKYGIRGLFPFSLILFSSNIITCWVLHLFSIILHGGESIK